MNQTGKIQLGDQVIYRVHPVVVHLNSLFIMVQFDSRYPGFMQPLQLLQRVTRHPVYTAKCKSVWKGVDFERKLVDIILMAGTGRNAQLNKIICASLMHHRPQAFKRPVIFQVYPLCLWIERRCTDHRVERVGSKGVRKTMGMKINNHGYNFPFFLCILIFFTT